MKIESKVVQKVVLTVDCDNLCWLALRGLFGKLFFLKGKLLYSRNKVPVAVGFVALKYGEGFPIIFKSHPLN